MENAFMSFSPAGIPQGSKLSTYLTSRTSKPPESVAVALGSLSLNSSPIGKGAGPPLVRSFTPDGAAEGAPLEGATAAVEEQAVDSTAGLFEENVGGTTYYYTAEDAAAQSSAEPPTLGAPYTAYVAPPARLADASKTTGGGGGGFFSSEQQRERLLRQQTLMLLHPNPAAYPELPTELDNFHQLCPLEPPNQPHKSAAVGYVTTCYKATNMKTGLYYCLRRIHGLRLSSTKCLQLVSLWSKINHPNLVTLRELFTTKSFGDNSVVMVYDLLPGAETLMTRHFSQPPQHNGFADPFPDPSVPRPYSAQKTAVLRQQGSLIPEPLIWSYVIQLTSALRQVHSSGLACRLLDPTKILVTGDDRLHINCCGVLDVLTFDSSASNPLALVPHYQQEDLVSLGKLLLALSCNSVLAVQRENFNTSISIVERHYSADLKTLIMSLLLWPSSGRQRGVDEVMPVIGARFYTQLEGARQLTDRLEDELSREIQNGRLFRLMAKLTAITERAELNLDGGWAETGDRYMLKLFRDYVFHAVTEEGRPFLDMAHVVQCLNKLDAGSSDKVCLMSRDMQNVLVVSYAELKQGFERSFLEVFEASLDKDGGAS